jgi:hypothetical protein
VYTRAFLARDLERHLTVHAGRKVWLVPKCPGVALVSIPYRVVLARDVSFPVRQ